MPPRTLTSRLVLLSAIMAGVFALAFFLLWPQRESAVQFRMGDIVVIEPWARATPGASKVGAAYLTIANRGTMPDRLVRAETTVAERVELHTTMTENDMMQMRPMESVAIGSGQTVQFAPSGMHLMLINLTAPLEEGESFPLRLTFERAGSFSVTVRIAGVGAQSPGHEGHDMGHSGH